MDVCRGRVGETRQHLGLLGVEPVEAGGVDEIDEGRQRIRASGGVEGDIDPERESNRVGEWVPLAWSRVVEEAVEVQREKLERGGFIGPVLSQFAPVEAKIDFNFLPGVKRGTTVDLSRRRCDRGGEGVPGQHVGPTSAQICRQSSIFTGRYAGGVYAFVELFASSNLFS